MWELAEPNHSVLENSQGEGFDVADSLGSTGSGGVAGYEGGVSFLKSSSWGVVCLGFVHVTLMTSFSNPTLI